MARVNNAVRMTDSAGRPVRKPTRRKVARFLSRAEVAAHLGLASVKSLSRIKLPQHDAQIGTRKGWLPSTIDEWNAQRPGSGRWGPR